MHEKWKTQFDKLEDGLDLFLEYYNKTKKCTCHIDECAHFDDALDKVFSKKVDDLWNNRLQVGFQTMNSNHSK